MKSSKRNPGVFEFKDFTMQQANSGQRVNTDSCVFASLIAPVTPPKKILDIGSGTGVVALMLASRFPNVPVTAVEPEIEIAEIAKKNFSASPWAGCLELVIAKAQDLNINSCGLFDLVALNPPYFLETTTSSDYLRAVARHTVSLGPKETFAVFARTMTEFGSAWLSCPTIDLDVWDKQGRQEGLHCMEKISIHDSPQSNSHITVLGWQRSPVGEVKSSSVFYRIHHQGTQSPWMRDFRERWFPKKYNDNLYI